MAVSLNISLLIPVHRMMMVDISFIARSCCCFGDHICVYFINLIISLCSCCDFHGEVIIFSIWAWECEISFFCLWTFIFHCFIIVMIMIILIFTCVTNNIFLFKNNQFPVLNFSKMINFSSLFSYYQVLKKKLIYNII